MEAVHVRQGYVMLARSTRLVAVMAVSFALAFFPLRVHAQQVENAVACDEGNISEPVPLNYGDHTTGCAIGPEPTDSDQFSVVGDIGDTLRIRVLSLTNDLDPRLEIRDPDGIVILDHQCTADRFGRCAFTLDSLTEPPLPVLEKAGTYLLTVSDNDGFNGGGYLLQLERIPPLITPPSVPYDAAVTDGIDPSTDVDFFTVDVAAASDVRIRVLSLTNDLDPRLEIRDPDGIVILDHQCTADRFGRCAFTLDSLTNPPLPPLEKAGIYLLTLSDNDGFNSGGYQIEIQCLFGACPKPDLEVLPAVIDFGNLAIGEPSQPTVVTVTSTGNVDLNLGTDFAIPVCVNAEDAEFCIQNNTCAGQTLPQGDQCTLEVVFTPQDEGDREAELIVSSNAPKVVVPLNGTGVEGPNGCDDNSGQLNIVTAFVAPGELDPRPVPVEVNVAPNALHAFGFEISYDATRLTFDSFTSGDLTGDFDFFDVNSPSPGIVRVAGVEAGAEAIGEGAAGTVVNLTFRVHDDVSPGTQLPLGLQNLVDDIQPFTISNACIITGCAHDGDVNMDREITPADALMAFQAFLELIELDKCQEDHADVLDPIDPSSDITPADALCIFNKFLGKPSCLDD